jgi:uncharacterized glyoxalase superfamily protein PhnB
MTYPTVFPTFSYDDAHAAIEFLANAFGAECLAVYEGDDGSIQHAEMRFGNGIVMFGSARGEFPATRGAGGVYIVVDDPDALYARAKNAGAEIARELRDEDYGSRGFGAKDPEGNTWFFGTYQPFAAQAEAVSAPGSPAAASR